MSWITIKLLGYRLLLDEDGNPLPQRSQMRLIGASLEDNPADGTTDVTLVGVGSVLAVTGQAPIIVTNNPDAQHVKISISNVTTSADGAMSSADKIKLNGIGAGAQVVSVSASGPLASSGGATPAISWNPTADVPLSAHGLTSCTGLANASGAVAIAAGAGGVSISASTQVDVNAPVIGTTFTSTPQATTDAASLTIDLPQTLHHVVNLTVASTAITLANARPGTRYTLQVNQPAGGGKAVTWGANVISWCGFDNTATTDEFNFTLWEFYCSEGSKFICLNRVTDDIP